MEKKMNILQINASIRATDANSTRVANSIVARLQAKHPAARLTVRDLGATPPAILDGTALAALFTPLLPQLLDIRTRWAD